MSQSSSACFPGNGCGKPDERCWKLFWLVLLPQQFAQFHPRLVQLRLRRADRTSEHPRDLFMLVPFDIMEHEDRAIARRQLRNRLVERDPIYDGHRVRIV